MEADIYRISLQVAKLPQSSHRGNQRKKRLRSDISLVIGKELEFHFVLNTATT